MQLCALVKLRWCAKYPLNTAKLLQWQRLLNQFSGITFDAKIKKKKKKNDVEKCLYANENVLFYLKQSIC